MNELEKATIRAIVNVFETGRVRGDYSAIAVLKGDSGHLSYGRSQTTLGSGNLYKLLNAYCQQPRAQFAAPLQPYLPRFQHRDVSLDTDATVRTLLRQAAGDPVMQATQDQFFNEVYFAPACRDAEQTGIVQPLGQAVVYDSHIQGGWSKLKSRLPGVATLGEKAWIGRYISLRKSWLQSLQPPLPSTVYRMDAFSALITRDNWNLALPLQVHGVTITQASLVGDVPAAGSTRRTLRLATPYLQGADVQALQKALDARGHRNTQDGIYGPFTDALVQKWQADHRIAEDGAGIETFKSLGI